MKKTPDIFRFRDMSLKVGLCQVLTQEWDVAGNLDRVLTAIETAAEKGAEVAVLPECVFHGYGFSGPEDFRKRVTDLAESVEGPCLSAVRDYARKYHLYVLVGFAERGEHDAVHNSAAFISPQGHVLDVYRKVHCRDFESITHDGIFTPGDQFSTYAIDVRDQRYIGGSLICFDREIPESVRCVRALGAEIIFCPLACDTESFEQNTDYIHNELITRCRAAENEVFIVVVNHAGRFNGGSFVVGPGGEVLCQLGSAPDVMVVEVPVGCVSKAFHSVPYGWMGWGFRRPEVYANYLLGPRH
ncbi:MAG TPA: carbon-nitrogen hydrolase family protein [Candidatus Hydrogenedentes bacterium]|nr:carbon-nitrogen hydrolase family protein [Candidatus Hydrogenedentota bacterium]HOL76244.1 carbon-nitrogen hydrolase family protein [Candidatus Hydrogenedentota bacterium]HPO86783.1 carbon-nitrogen hydrolase family protein [Candidatus Hydrogenedentota bacterium]